MRAHSSDPHPWPDPDPQPDPTPDPLAELSRAGMRSYLRYWMESFRLPAWSELPADLAVSLGEAGIAATGLPTGVGARLVDGDD